MEYLGFKINKHCNIRIKEIYEDDEDSEWSCDHKRVYLGPDPQIGWVLCPKQ